MIAPAPVSINELKTCHSVHLFACVCQSVCLSVDKVFVVVLLNPLLKLEFYTMEICISDNFTENAGFNLNNSFKAF